MPDYDLSILSNRTFEHLIQALATKVIGPDVMPFGDGPDGGREATFDGKVNYPSSENGWDGYGVIQAKFLQRPSSTYTDGQWAISQLKSEMEKYLQPATNWRKPDYFVFATNVVLSAVSESGSKDQIVKLLEGYKTRLSLKHYAIWDYDQIRVFLDDNEGVRRSYAAWITPGDVLAEVMKWLQPKTPDLENTLINFLQKELLSDEFVNLEQAGHSADERIPLARVFVDLHTREYTGGGTPILDDDLYYEHHLDSSESWEQGFIKEMLNVSSDRLDPQSQYVHSIAQSMEITEPPQPQGRYVLIGGPGQGKTTVGQFICQIFRAAIIVRKPTWSLSSETVPALEQIKRHCEDEGIERMPVPRFPFRIVLNEFATALSSDSLPGVNSIWSFISNKIGHRTDRDVSADDIRSWIGQYPCLIIFDGLDEVPSSSNREQVLGAIRDFWIDASAANADILAIATSRPQGYNQDFSPAYYEHRVLVPLSPELGRHFAARLADVRYGTDLDRKAKVLERLERAFENEATSRLMRSPLQVTIMTALVDQMGQPPQLRWDLFNLYYDVIFRREVERAIPASDILRTYGPDINAIHNRVALLLHIDSERSGGTDAKLSAERFRYLVEARLKEEGHPEGKLQQLTQDIFDAALERLVFLVGLEAGQIGFEIRSLQEFMAAECLMEASDAEVGIRLKEIAPIPHWRNVFLFAAGKCSTERQHLRGGILSICTELNDSYEDPIARTLLVGSNIAISLLDDGPFRFQPGRVRDFARIAMRAMEMPDFDSHFDLCGCYEPDLQNIYQEEIARRLNDPREYVQIGAWRCLMRLADADVGWAMRSAEDNWPDDPEQQFAWFNSGSSFRYRLGQWSARKYLKWLPLMPVSAWLPAYGLSRLVKGQILEEQEAIANMLNPPRESFLKPIHCLRARLYFPVIQTSDEGVKWLDQFGNVDGWHVSWLAYKVVREFVQSPTKENLSAALKSLVPFWDDIVSGSSLNWQVIPWPLLSCLSVCKDGAELSKIADRAGAGELGDIHDWIAAENRWTERGVVLDDFLSMPDGRLPFDSDIANTGFPISMPLWPMVPHGEEDRFLSNAMVILSQLPKGMSRTFVARMVHSRLLDAAFTDLNYESTDSRDTFSQALESLDLSVIYADLPTVQILPLSVCIKRLSRGTSLEIADAFAELAAQGHKFRVFGRRIDPATEEDLVRLCAAFEQVPDKSVLLPIIGLLAENGSLTRDMVRVPAYEPTDHQDHKIAKLMCLIAFETWQSDNTDRLISLIKDVESQLDDVYDRVLTAISANRSQGPFLDQLLVRLEVCLPHDNYNVRERHASLMEDRLRQRISKFADPMALQKFNPPAGLTELLVS